jgi:hypothetical protein
MKQRKFLALIPVAIILVVTLIFAGRALFVAHSTPAHAAAEYGSVSLYNPVKSPINSYFMHFIINGVASDTCNAADHVDPNPPVTPHSTSILQPDPSSGSSLFLGLVDAGSVVVIQQYTVKMVNDPNIDCHGATTETGPVSILSIRVVANTAYYVVLPDDSTF